MYEIQNISLDTNEMLPTLATKNEENFTKVPTELWKHYKIVAISLSSFSITWKALPTRYYVLDITYMVFHTRYYIQSISHKVLLTWYYLYGIT